MTLPPLGRVRRYAEAGQGLSLGRDWWTHADPRMETLHAAVTGIVEADARAGRDGSAIVGVERTVQLAVPTDVTQLLVGQIDTVVRSAARTS